MIDDDDDDGDDDHCFMHSGLTSQTTGHGRN